MIDYLLHFEIWLEKGQYSVKHKHITSGLNEVRGDLGLIILDYEEGSRQGWLHEAKRYNKEYKRAKTFVAKIDERLKFREQIRILEAYVGERPRILKLKMFVCPE